MLKHPREIELQNLYEKFKKESYEFGFKYPIEEVNNQLITFLFEHKIKDAIDFVATKRLEFWKNYVKERLSFVEGVTKPRVVFEESVFEELQNLKRIFTSADSKFEKKDQSVIDEYEEILGRVEKLLETVSSIRNKSAIGFLLKTIQWGVLVGLASLPVIFYFISPNAYVIPIPFVVMLAIALIGYFVVKRYPTVATRANLIQLVYVIITLVVTVLISFLIEWLPEMLAFG